VALLLDRYLTEQGMGDFQYISAERGHDGEESTWCTHAWLVQQGLIIDITADQFLEINESVIVTANSPWHASWSQEIAPGWYSSFISPDYLIELEDCYRRILEKCV
jgi:hypothetical protein